MRDQINDGIEIWDTNKLWPISNPDEYPETYSLETPFGSSLGFNTAGQEEFEQNYVTISPGFHASNVSFPDNQELDEFIAADKCVTADGVACCVVSTISDSGSSDRLELGAKPELSDCEDEDC